MRIHLLRIILLHRNNDDDFCGKQLVKGLNVD